MITNDSVAHRAPSRIDTLSLHNRMSLHHQIRGQMKEGSLQQEYAMARDLMGFSLIQVPDGFQLGYMYHLSSCIR